MVTECAGSATILTLAASYLVPLFVFGHKKRKTPKLSAQYSKPRPSSPARFKTENRYQNRLLPMNIRPPTTLPGRLGGVLRQLLQE